MSNKKIENPITAVRSGRTLDSLDASVLTDAATFLKVSFHRVGVKRKLRESEKAEITVDADKELVHVHKDLLDCDEYRAIVSHDNQTYAQLRAMTLPATGMGHGTYVCPLAILEDVIAMLRTCETNRTKLIKEFCLVYPDEVKRSKRRLRSLFDDGDYPSIEQVRASFAISWRLLQLTVPTNIPAKLRVDEEFKMREAMEETVASCRTALRVGFAKIVGRMAERLEDPERIFRDTLVENMIAFMDSFDKLNLTRDGELAGLVTRARTLLGKVDAADLRTDMELREKIAVGMARIEKALDPLLTERPLRKMTLRSRAAS